MALIALTIFAIVVGQAVAYPLGPGPFGPGGFGPGPGGFGPGPGDFGPGGFGPGPGGFGPGPGDFGPGGFGYGGFGGWGWGDGWGFGGVGYPPSRSYARENYVRPSWGGPEFGTRNEVTYRPGYFGGPYSPSYGWYSPYNAYGGDWGFGGGNYGGDWGFGGGNYGGYWGFGGGIWGGFGYPGSTSYARENYVRPSWNGPEYGTRNEVNYRPGYFGGPYSPGYGPWAYGR